MKRSPMARRATKKRPGHDKAMLTACRGEWCYLRIPGVCIGGTETTVPAHSNESAHGKGMGLKAADVYTVPACFACHSEIDQGNKFSREEKFIFWRHAYAAWVTERKKKLAQKNSPALQEQWPGFSSTAF